MNYIIWYASLNIELRFFFKKVVLILRCGPRCSDSRVAKVIKPTRTDHMILSLKKVLIVNLSFCLLTGLFCLCVFVCTLFFATCEFTVVTKFLVEFDPELETLDFSNLDHLPFRILIVDGTGKQCDSPNCKTSKCQGKFFVISSSFLSF
jgi:hypothetical protein